MEELICVRCGKPVKVYPESYQVFERMHWLSFHLEFEHEGDPDEPCGDPTCPWWHIQVYKRALERSGHSPEEVLTQAMRERWDLDP